MVSSVYPAASAPSLLQVVHKALIPGRSLLVSSALTSDRGACSTHPASAYGSPAQALARRRVIRQRPANPPGRPRPDALLKQSPLRTEMTRRRDATDGLFLVNGCITELHIGAGRHNLFAEIDTHYRGKSMVAGAGSVVGDMFGLAASSAMLATYDGEDTQNFAYLLDGEVVCGQFAGAEMLQNGDQAKVVVSRHGQVLVAHAIMCSKRGYLWIAHPWGLRAEALANLRMGVICFIGGIIGSGFLGWLAGAFTPENIDSILLGGLVFAGLCLGMTVWANTDMRALAGPATEMLRLLGFANPDKVNLKSYAIDWLSWRDHVREKTATYLTQDKERYQHADVYCYQRAIDDGKLALTK